VKYFLLNVLFFVLLCIIISPIMVLLMGFNTWAALATGVLCGFIGRMITDKIKTGHFFGRGM
jgi:hypothetical protein